MRPWPLLVLLALPVFARDRETINLWAEGRWTNWEDNASVTVYLPEKEKQSAAGVLVVPGGSFLIRCEDHEGAQVANWFAERGIAAFVVHYRLIPRFTMREEMDDVRRAVQVVRSRAAEFGVQKLGMIGFSAGAYLTGEAALKPWAADAAAREPVAKFGSHLDFMGLVYGAPAGTNDAVAGFNKFFAEQVGGSNEWRQLTATTPVEIAKAPPAFMFCTVEDRAAARRMAEFHLQLLQQGVSSEAHFFASGPHGVGFAQGDPVLGEWPELLLNWMRAKEFLLHHQSQSVAGLVMVNGKPLELGYVVFKPRSSSNVPPRTAYVFNRGGQKGAFRLTEGLVPGEYEATVFQMAARWNSVWAEPLLTGLQTKLQQGGELSESEVADFKKWASSREYRPTQADLVRFAPIEVRVTPQNASALRVEVQAP